MKIAFLSLYSGHVNRGVETWTHELASRLAQRGKDVLVLQGERYSVKKAYKTKVVKIKIIRKLRSGENMLSQILSFPYLLALNLTFTLRSIPCLIKYKPDIILPGNGGIQNLILRLASWIFGWKMVIVGHAGIGAPDKWNMLMRPDYYIYPSKRNLSWAKNLIYSRGLNMESIPHGIDLKKFSQNKKIKIPIERPIVLCVSSLDPHKRVNLAVQAVSKMKNGSLLLIGGDRGGNEVDGLAMKLLGKKRYLKIQVKPEDIPQYYSSSDVFTLPSNEFEAFGIVYLEAMASGLPVVATDDKLRREIIGDAGILVDPRNSKRYAQALEKAITSTMHSKSKQRAKLFAWNKIVNKYEEVFRKLV